MIESACQESPQTYRPPVGDLPFRFRLRDETVANGRAFLLGEGYHRVGRASNNRLTLPDEGVSRRHAVIRVLPECVVVEDAGSRNGTFVNGIPVERTTLAPGDRVAFGPVELRVEALHPDDAELAMEISDSVPGAERLENDRLEPTRCISRISVCTAAWLQLVRHFFDALHSGGGAALALAAVTQELGVRGACLVDVSEQREPILLAACGDLDPACLETLQPNLDRATPRFLSRSAATALLPADLPAGLVVFGDFVGRPMSEPLLATLLRIYQGFHPQRPAEHSAGRRAKSLADLHFPDSWVHGVSPAMNALYEQMRPLAGSDLPILIAGETGVGKELIAKALHLSSPRREGPFVAINCAAIPADLLEAELFGIAERVATGVAGRKGYFQQAASGTLFLDEIADMPATLQTKLLRVLQEKTLRPVGGTPIPIEVRVVAATNADLEARLEQGSLRRDLFYRIAGFVLQVPPLRERREDVPLLVESLLRRFSDETGNPVRGISVRALRALVEHDWLGNVRELEHVLRGLVHLCPTGQAIERTMLPESIAATATSPAKDASRSPATAGERERPGTEDAVGTATFDLAELERRTIREALRRCDGNKARTARLLGISRGALRRRIERYGPAPRPPAESDEEADEAA